MVQLPALSDGDGAQILQDRWAGSEDGRQLQHLGSATQQDAELISRAFHANPLMLRIVGDGLRLRHMTLDQAKSGLGLADAAYGNKTLGQVRATRPDVHTDTVALGTGVAVTWKQAMSICRYISRMVPCGQPLCSYQEALLIPRSLSLLTPCMHRSWIECSAA